MLVPTSSRSYKKIIGAVTLLAISTLWPNDSGSSAQAPLKNKTSEQTGFSVEQDIAPVEKPEVLPPEALPVLAQEAGVASCLQSNELVANQLPASWFVASRIHLGGPNETDYVVLPNLAINNPESSARCFLGPNTGQFWVLRKTPKSYVLLLSVWTHSLDVLPSRSNGLRDIEPYTIAIREDTKTIFRFDGRQYRKHTERTRPNG
jgi:hypothetical protein